MLFILSKNVFSSVRYLNFCPDFFGHAAKQLDKKDKDDLKVYDVINWEINNYNTHIL